MSFSVPSKPPVNLAARNTSSTSIRVTWRQVPSGFLHGILRGYRVFYKKTDDNNTTYIDASIGSTERELDITGLEKFTRYSVKVLAFTRKGNGPVSHNISVLTDEDGIIYLSFDFLVKCCSPQIIDSIYKCQSINYLYPYDYLSKSPLRMN